MEFGMVLREVRKSNKLSMRLLAEYVGVSQTTIAKIEKGDISPFSDTSRKIREMDIFNEEEIARMEKALPDNDPNGVPISEIPGFYDKLNSLYHGVENLNHVDVNHPVLQELRVALGGERIVKDMRHDYVN